MNSLSIGMKQKSRKPNCDRGFNISGYHMT